MKWSRVFFWRRSACQRAAGPGPQYAAEHEQAPDYGSDEIGLRIAKLSAKHDRELNRITRRIDAAFDRLDQQVAGGVETALLRMEGKWIGIASTLDAASRATTEVNQQLVALREYAAQQQNLIRRFQDGYDLKILRDITLRIMVVVDGIDRLTNTEATNADPSTLTRVREDLLVALDATGMESFAPTPGVLYRGLEKEVEVIRTEPATDPARSGTISGIVRRGIRYLGADGNMRVIRTAQVVVAQYKETPK